MYLRTSFLCWTFLLLKFSSSTDPCTNYVRIDEPDRSSSRTGVAPYLCDTAIDEGWYRSVSDAGPDIPTSPVPVERCGTQYPIWMNDTLPQNGTEKSVKLCMHHPSLGECFDPFYVTVKNCDGEYNVYKLIQTSGCPMRYCLGTKEKCPKGTFSDTGFAPGCEVLPNVSLSPSVVAGIYETTFKGHIFERIRFDCKLNSIPKDKDQLRYKVEWFIETYSVANYSDKTYSELLTGAYLPEDKWAGKYYMGFNVKCTMRVRFHNGTMYGNVSKSNDFYAGFQAEPSQLHLQEGETKYVNINLTVPLGGFRNGNSELILNAMQPYHQSYEQTCDQDFEAGSIVFQNIKCSVSFHQKSWNISKTLKITGQSDNAIKSHGRNAYIRLTALRLFEHEAWSFAAIPDIKVHVADNMVTKNRICKSNNDPYITTFDGKRYPNQGFGEFLLYKHAVHPVQVNVMNMGCTQRNTGSCACGVVVRHDNHLFTANFCGHISKEFVAGMPRNRFIERLNCDDKYMTIAPGSDNDYKIVLPTGTTVTIAYAKHSSFGWWIPFINIKPSVFDWQQSSGLCGYFDNDIDNDFVVNGTKLSGESFIKHWRVQNTSAESLFQINKKIQPSKVNLRQYCKCETNISMNCDLVQAMVQCTNKTVNPNIVGSYFKQCALKRTKRDTDVEDDDNFDKIEITYSDDYFQDSNKTIEWIDGWNEETARQKCTEYFDNSPIVSICKNIVPEFQANIDGSIQDCIDDIKATGDVTFIESSLAALSNVCVMEASTYENLTSGNSSKPLLDDILDVSCVNNCSGNGICAKGTCQCFGDFHGPRCSLRRTDAPTFDKNMNSGLCKTDQKSCQSYGIIVDNIIPGFYCKARHFKVFVDDEGTQVNVDSSPTVFFGIYVNDFSVKCKIPNSRKRRAANPETVIADGYHISVSNDGVTYSEEITFVNFDSTCYECNSTDIACSLIGDDDTCAPAGKIPQKEEDKVSAQGSNVFALICIGVAIVCVVIGLIVIIRITKNTSSREVETTNLDLRVRIALPKAEDDIYLHGNKSSMDIRRSRGVECWTTSFDTKSRF